MANVETKHETVLDVGTTRSRLARIYAEALLAAAAQKSPQAIDEVGTELSDFVREVVAENPSVGTFIANPTVGKKPKTAALLLALDGRASELLRGLVTVLAHNNRLDLLRGIAAAYLGLLDDRAGRVLVRVASAAPLSGTQQSELTTSLQKLLRQEPVLDVRVDPDLLGGLVIQVGDSVIDTSVRTRLRSLRTLLLDKGGSNGNN
ncbi:ATP synthase subunit delta, sodium ion specific [Gemmata sp. SH-PL17]|uniref:ATP synthase F1 subunit delta n=1 Tax=Gemmata sp. SH-PL17 TaxID=1630693 RepID=UPI00078C9656|nr:ATP synthase F1 subunit delta [Gemmata sp. SH-PL17]AMV26957.1 ATP synthase subunit delta, sodium ion specific [Gemmata sp. SH-PL17]